MTHKKIMKRIRQSSAHKSQIDKRELHRILDETRGHWIFWPRNSDVAEFCKSLDTFPTGWCIHNAQTAEDYLSCSAFHIYYSNSVLGSIPRIAIVVDDDCLILEIRGIGYSQNIDMQILPVLPGKLFDLGVYDECNRECYKATLRIKKLYGQFQKKERFSIDDLKFLYEYHDSWGFTPCYELLSILRSRSEKDDLDLLYREHYETGSVLSQFIPGKRVIFDDQASIDRIMKDHLANFTLYVEMGFVSEYQFWDNGDSFQNPVAGRYFDSSRQKESYRGDCFVCCDMYDTIHYSELRYYSAPIVISAVEDDESVTILVNDRELVSLIKDDYSSNLFNNEKI